jgi:hypothetical protein
VLGQHIVVELVLALAANLQTFFVKYPDLSFMSFSATPLPTTSVNGFA